MKRFPDWPARLHAFLCSRRRAAFQWSQNDCALFVADGVLAMTGTDLAADYRGTYDDEEGALEAIAGPLEAFAAAAAVVHAMPEVAPALGQRGDIMLLPGLAGDTLGLCTGTRIACCASPAGYGLVPVAQASRCWRV